MQIGAKSDVGKVKKINQDFLFYSTEPIGKLDNLFIIADGMGGHKAGDIASKFTVNSIVEYLKKEEDNELNIENLLFAIIKKVDKELTLKANSNVDYNGMGTTLVLATIHDDEMFIANIGDSRLYILMDKLRQITEDHSRVMELIKSGEITMMEAKNHIDRNKVTRAVGYGGYPDFYKIRVKKDDFVLLCTDGLTNMVDDITIENIIRENNSINNTVDKLVETANENGGEDNISAILVNID